jgi:hemoglobin-like flavoprotein
MSNGHNNEQTNNSSICPYTTSPTQSSPALLDTAKATGFSLPQTKSAMAQAHRTSSSFIDASQTYSGPIAPTQAQVDIVRYTWERLCEIRLDTDDPAVSPSHAFGLAFYDALFRMDPSLKSLFSNIFQQARALSGMIAYIARAPMVTGSISYGSEFSTEKDPLTIRDINARKRKQSTSTSFHELVTNAVTDAGKTEDNSERLLHQLRELGARHYFYDVKPEHFPLVGPAVLQALQARLGKEYLPEVADAWTSVSRVHLCNKRIWIIYRNIGACLCCLPYDNGARITDRLGTWKTKIGCNKAKSCFKTRKSVKDKLCCAIATV